VIRYTRFLGTEQNRFRRKTDEIAKFSMLDEKWSSKFWTEFGRKIGKWPTDGGKNVELFHIHLLCRFYRAMH